MTEHGEWEAVYQELIQDERERLGELPAVDELIAYMEGKLPTDRAERIQDYLAIYPELARDLGQPLSEPRPGDRDYATDAELEECWAALDPVSSSVVASEAQIIPPMPHRGFAGSLLATVAAAALAVVLGTLYWGAHGEIEQLRAELRSPRTNPVHRLLLPDGRRGDGDPPILLSAEQDYFLLKPSLISEADYPDYRLKILRSVDGQEIEVWEASGLRRRLNDTFELWMPRSFLRPGEYQLKLFGISESDGETLLATYTIQTETPSSHQP